MLRSLLIDPSLLRIVLLSIGVALLLCAYVLHRIRRRRNAAGSPTEAHIAQYYPPARRRRPWLAEVFRVALLFAALIVAGTVVLTLMPDTGMDRLTDYVRSTREAGSPPSMVGFLYLGDEVRGSEFHIRGVVRNISSAPIEHLDALVRLYGHDGYLIETTVVRMDSENILPDETAQFHLVYPGYKGQFGGYSVDFKLRQGELVPYKDMRSYKDRS